ncbi:inositol monophosphatase family protein [Hyphomicrobium sp.]|uniref:inositol monophosphatase family protein n=1 Tax=Hyphomicrobium sp. TaxID=82 RepID=UPI0025C4A01E|nr:inositol monophosphatase family protein [Hyphomicrobium sp.]
MNSTLFDRSASMSNDILALHDFANVLADKARRLARKHFRKTTAYERKADESPVTIADKAIEAELRALIMRRYPQHGILGEEMGGNTDGNLLWVLDPIDGTKSFLTGMPLFGTLIAFLQDGEAKIGVIEIPPLGERWSAFPGAARHNQKPCHTSGCTSLKDARVYTSSPDFFHDPNDWDRYDRVSRAAAIRRFGGDCYQYGLLASGYCDLVIEASLMPYDFLALVPIVETAGGKMTDWEGRPLTVNSGQRVIAAATPQLHDEALRMLNS